MTAELLLLAGIAMLLATGWVARLRRQRAIRDAHPSSSGQVEPGRPDVMEPDDSDEPSDEAMRDPEELRLPRIEDTDTPETCRVPLRAGQALRSAIASIRGSGWAVCLLGFVAFGVDLALRKHPWWTLIALTARCVWLAGGASITMHSLRGEDPGPERLLDGLRSANRVLGATILVGWPALAGYVFAYLSLHALHWIVPYTDMSFPLVPEVYTFLMVTSVAVAIACTMYVLPRLWVAICVAVDTDASVRGTARRTVALLSGNMGRATAFFVTLALFSGLALRLSPVAFLFTEPLLATTSAAIYEQLRTSGSTQRVA